MPVEQGHRHYRWDQSSRLIGFETSEQGKLTGKRRYRYDARDQISTVEHFTGHSTRREHHAYDAIGHLKESGLNQSAAAHHYQGDSVSRIGHTTYHYDARGRMVKRTIDKPGFRPQSWHYRWDEFDHLRQVKTPQGDIWAYTYDAFGRRISKRCLEGKNRISQIHYLWQGAAMVEASKIYADGTPEFKQTTHYKPGSFEPIAQEQKAANDEDSEFFPIVIGPDGAPAEIYTANGRRVWQADKTLWGETEIDTKLRRQILPGRATGDEAMLECDLRFMGQWYDEESGLHYNLHRYYDPQTGQYLSTDPLGLQGGINTHAYVHDPVNWCDPWGLTDVNATGINGQGYDIYVIKDASGKAVYVGMTENYDVRQQQHIDSGRYKPSNGMSMERLDHAKTYGEARGAEQYHIDTKKTLDLNARGVYDEKGKIPAGAEGNRANSYDKTRELNPEDKRAEAFKKGYEMRSGKCGV